MSDNIDIITGISQRSRLSPILYLFYNADLIGIFCTTDEKITDGKFIDDVFLLATNSNILQNCQLLKKRYWLYRAKAKQNKKSTIVILMASKRFTRLL